MKKTPKKSEAITYLCFITFAKDIRYINNNKKDDDIIKCLYFYFIESF